MSKSDWGAWRLVLAMSIALGTLVIAQAIAPSLALAAGEIVIEPSEVDFGVHPRGETALRTVVATNSGPDEVVLTEVALIGDVDPFDFVDGTCEPATILAVGGSCNVQLGFSPIGFQARVDEALLVIEGGEQDELGLAMLSGRTAASSAFTATPSFLRFSFPRPGTADQTRSVTIRNRSMEIMAFNPPTISGPFRITRSLCPSLLTAGASCEIRILFEPPSGSRGTLTGMLNINGDGHGRSVSLFGATLPMYPRLPSSSTWSIEARRAELAELVGTVPGMVRGGPSGWQRLPRFEAGAAGWLSVALFGWKGKRRIGIGEGTRDFTAPSIGRLRFRLNKRGVALLRRPQRTRIKVVGKFEPYDGFAVRRASEFVVKPPKAKKAPAKRR